MKTIKTFPRVLANNLTPVAAVGMALGTITLCCAFCDTEGCDPCITITDPTDNIPVCSSTVFERVITTCDDWDDLVKVNNSLVSPPTTLEWWDTQEGTALIWEDWDGGNYAAHLAAGINKLTATTADCGLTSSEVDVASNGGGGPAGNYTCLGKLPQGCGLYYDLAVFCLSPTTSYQIYEDPARDGKFAYINGQSCDPSRNGTWYASSKYISTDGYGTLDFGINGFFDIITYSCPGYPAFDSSCGTISFTKQWVVCDKTTKQVAFTGSSETVSFGFSSNPRLTVSDSALANCNQPFP